MEQLFYLNNLSTVLGRRATPEDCRHDLYSQAVGTYFFDTCLFKSSSSVSLSYFILAVPMRECLGKHVCMSSPYPIAILNGTSPFSLWCK